MADNKLKQFNKIKVLIVEDIPEDAELMKRELENSGYLTEVSVVDDEGGLVAEIKSLQPDVILSDYSLPEFTGFEVLGIAQTLCPDVPLIFVTGTIGEEIAAETVLNGASGLVLKSNLKKLPEVVNRAFEKEGRWYSKRAKFASERINKRIQTNIQALNRIQGFLDSKKGAMDKEARDEAKNAIETLMRISEKL